MMNKVTVRIITTTDKFQMTFFASKDKQKLLKDLYSVEQCQHLRHNPKTYSNFFILTRIQHVVEETEP